MIGILARKRANLTALAVLAALVAAMFIALGPAQAQSTPTIVFTSDTDAVVKSGTPVTAQLQYGDDSAAQSANWVVQVGLLVGSDAATPPLGRAINGATSAYISTIGAADGEYKIVATATISGVNNGESASYEATLTVGDQGSNLGSVEIALGKVGHSTVVTDAADGSSAPQFGATDPTYAGCVDSDGTADGNQPNGNCIALTVTAKNSLGAKANADDVTAIHLFAPLATIVVNNSDTNIAATADNNDGTVNIGGAAASAKFFVTKAEAGTVNVTAIVLGPSGSQTSTPVELTFTGDAATISVNEASGPLATSGTRFRAEGAGIDADGDSDYTDEGDIAPADDEGQVAIGVANFEVTATDKSGNAAAPTGTSVDSVKNSNGIAIGEITAVDRDKAGAPLTRIFELAGVNAKPGTYTVTFKFGTQKIEREIVVAGDVANVELTADVESAAIGDFVTVTATVTDNDGNLRPDAGVVTFTSVGALKLEALDDSDSELSGAQRHLNDGVATLEYAVVDGSGTATIIARIAGKRGVVSVSSGDDTAMMDDEASIGCLKNLSAFSSWTCEVESSASEVFGWLADRGASALHLHNGATWVRYSVVDGGLVPGSSDFTITEGDILYISN